MKSNSRVHNRSTGVSRLLQAGAAMLLLSSGAQANLLANGDFTDGTTGWDGFYNLVNLSSTTADDAYYGQALVNLHLTEAGAVQFDGQYDRYSSQDPVSYRYHYLLAPQKPHLSQSLFLAAGEYTLSWDDVITTYGMTTTQNFEVLLDGVQVYSQGFWVPLASGGYGALESGHKSQMLTIADSGTHTLSFGMDVPGFTYDYVYTQWANHITVDNLSLVAAPVPEPETYAMLLAGLALVSLRLKR
jgi:hypothetical protein